MKIAFDRNLVCRKILFSEISGDLLAFILKKNIKYKTMHVYRKENSRRNEKTRS